MRGLMGKRPFMARFEWWPDVRFWGAYPLAAALIPAGLFGIGYEVFVVGEYVCFHSTWGAGSLIWAGAMLFFHTRRLRRFNKLMADKSQHGFLEHRDELAELITQLPRKQRQMYKDRLAETTERGTRRKREDPDA